MSSQSNFKEVIFRQDGIYSKSIFIIQVFYATVLILLQYKISSWQDFATRQQIVNSWPVDWIFKTSDQYFYLTLLTLVAVCASLYLIFNPFNLIMRLIGYLPLQIHLSYYLATQGYDNHSYYGYTLISTIFLFLPHSLNYPKGKGFIFKQRTIQCMWFSAACLIGIYFLVGIAQIHGAYIQISSGQLSILSPKSTAYFILYELQTFGKTSILGEYVINHYFTFWLFSFFIIVEKITAPIFLFKTKYLPYIGLLFVLFHLFNALAFGLPFRDLSFQLILFLILNPIKHCRRVIPRKVLKY